MESVKKNAKAWVAAGVAFVASVVAARYGFEIPVEWQLVVVSAIMSVVTGLLTYLIPNKQ